MLLLVLRCGFKETFAYFLSVKLGKMRSQTGIQTNALVVKNGKWFQSVTED
jgi:hypothetical protein